MDIQNIGRYEIKRELGRGGMATVYLAFDPSFDRDVAIKVLPREFLHNPQFLDRFQREIKTIAQLEHPAIVPVYDVGEHDGLPFFVMRFMPGGSLSDIIENGRIQVADAARITERLASALSYAHRKGIVHRDLKPDNILFDSDEQPFISDFGIAKFSQAQTNLTGSGIIGTPAYMSPEQATGDTLDHRSDIYGLGVIVYQMLTGEQPFNADTPMGVAIKHVTDPIPEIVSIATDLPSEMNDVMRTVLAKNRDERYPTAVEFARALNQVAFGHPGDIKESQPTMRLLEKAVPVKNRKFVVGGLIGAAVLILLFIFGGKLFAGNQNLEPQQPIVETVLITVTDSLIATSPPTVAAFAPACAPPENPPAPPLLSSIKETGRRCQGGVPYTTFLIPKDVTYSVSDDEFECEFVTERSDGNVIVCTGKPLFAFEIEFCNPSNTPDLIVGSSSCPANAAYDEANQCCAPIPTNNNSACIVYKTGTTGCGG